MRIIRGTAPRGIGFPIDKGRNGYWSRKNAAALRKTSIQMILGTRVGERVGEPEFGSRLHELIFEPNDEILVQEIIEETADAIERWDPFVDVQGVVPEIRDNKIDIFIDYIDLSDETRQPRQVVFGLTR